MPAKRKRYEVYRNDKSDDENNKDLPQARVLSRQKNGQLIVESNRSPQKRGIIRQQDFVDEWEPSADFHTALESVDFDVGYHNEAEEEMTAEAKAMAKRYPTSVRGLFVTCHPSLTWLWLGRTFV